MVFLIFAALAFLAPAVYAVVWVRSYQDACRTYLLVPPEASERFAVIVGLRPPICAEIPLRMERLSDRMHAVHFERRLIPTYLFRDVKTVMAPV